MPGAFCRGRFGLCDHDGDTLADEPDHVVEYPGIRRIVTQVLVQPQIREGVEMFVGGLLGFMLLHARFFGPARHHQARAYRGPMMWVYCGCTTGLASMLTIINLH